MNADLPGPSATRVIEVSDSERRILLRLLDDKWWDLDRDSEAKANDLELSYMRDLEVLVEKLK